MKNLPVSMKLILSFAMVIVLAVVVGVVGIVGMNSINNADDEMYEYNLKAVSAMGEIREILQRQRVAMRHYPLYADDHASLTAAKTSMDEWERSMEVYFAEYEATITDESAESAYYNAKNLYMGTFATMKKEIYEQSLISYQAGHDRLFDPSVVATTDEIAQGFTTAMANNNTWAKEQVDANTTLFNNMTFIEIAVLAVAVIFAMFLAFYISSLIAKPLGVLTGFMKKAGGIGDISMSAAEAEDLRRFGQARDEIGQCISSTSSFLKHITTVSHELEIISGGDLTGELVLLSDKDTIGLSLQKTVNNLNTMFSEIHSSTAQVSAGSKQIADGAQALAQGSTQQAAAVEELSSSITEIADMTKTNADMADKAAHLASTIKQNAEKGSRQMDEMMGAVKEINQASHSINKVIKVIDDIAFQTNILALNAAVEAARAGQHGKGFAVVAEEVRNLAAKSAEAAKDTGGLIANSIEKAELGARIADDTAASLSEIVTGINESNQLVADIAKSSDEQAQGIAQINKGIDQVAQVIQQNSATAEESAAASQEMSGQANMLEDLIAQFKIRDDGSHRLSAGSSRSGSSSAPKRLAMPEKRTSYAPPAGNGGDFGKY